MSEPTSFIPLTYATVAERRAPIALYYLALLCAVIPMSTGLICLFGYWLTQETDFAVFGFLLLFLGGGLVFLGFIFSGIYLRLAKRATIDQQGSLRRAHKVQWLLFACIPVAIFCAFTGQYLYSHPVITFTLHNGGSKVIDGGVLSSGERSASFGPLASGASVKVNLRCTAASLSLMIRREANENTVPLRGFGDDDGIPFDKQATIEIDNGGASMN